VTARPTRSHWTLIAVIALAFVAAPSIAPGSVAHLGSAHASPPHAAGGATLAGAPIVPTTAPSSGRGTFFVNQPVPLVPTANQPCPSIYGTPFCLNNTDEPSLNLTATGLLAVAYTAFANPTPCPGMVGNTTTMVGFQASNNLGATWSTPIYLGNPDCTGYDANFANAAQPSLTSLANGTLVLAYEEYNFTTNFGFTAIAPQFDCYDIVYSRIVVSLSYDAGVTWTDPEVLDNTTSSTACPSDGFPDLQPSATAFGDSIYVAWTNLTIPYPCGVSAGVTLAASLDGGASWQPTSTLANVNASTVYCFPTTTSASMNPALAVAPDGTLYVAYLTGLGQSNFPPYYVYDTGTVELASSTTNGSTFAYSTIASHQLLMEYRCCLGTVFTDPMPSIAIGGPSGQIYVGWAAPQLGYFCTYYGSGSYCYAGADPEGLWFANSSDGGATFTAGPVVNSLYNPNGGPYNQFWNPSIAVTTDGVVHMQASFENDSVCMLATYGYPTCGAMQQVYLNTSNDGASWSDPVLVSPNWTIPSDYYQLEDSWTGQYSSIVPLGTSVLLAWTFQDCPVASIGSCYGYGGGGSAGVVLSTKYAGAGVTVTFSETGLPSGAPWSANILGNERAGVAPGALSISGVPPSAALQYAVPWVNVSYGDAFSPSLSPASPATFPTSGSVAVTFSELVLLNVQTSPSLQSYCWLYSGDCSNWFMTPAPGSVWVTPGTPTTVSLVQVPFSPYCSCYNMSFLSWTGSGPGNVTTLSPTITVTPTGPVNETANFAVIAYCYPYTGVCWNQSYNPVTFVETGLPANVPWSVTTVSANGTVATNTTSTSDTLGFLLPATPSTFAVWSVPDPTSGDVWVATTDIPSPIAPLAGSTVHVTYTLEPASSAEFGTTFVANGLPPATPWTLALDGNAYGVQANNTTLSTSGGGPHGVNGSAIYLASGVGYSVDEIDYTPYVENATPSSGSAPASLDLQGPGVVTLDFAPMYLLTTAASTGGTVTPATGWNAAGTTVTLTANASNGYHFVGWTGTGGGSTTVSQDSQTSPTIMPTGPVTEFATFRPNATPTWNLTVSAVGLPAGTAYTISIGGTAYAGAGTFPVGNLTNGTYAVQVPYIYLNSSSTTRFVPTSVTSSLMFGPGSVLDVTGDGTIAITYTTQYAVTIASTPAAGGTVTPTPGTAWYDDGSLLNLTATPASGYEFLGWNSTTGAVTTTDSATSVTVDEPIAITGQFAVLPTVAPSTWWLTITETGLPAGVGWNVSLGSSGASGSGTSLAVGGLNGTYTLTIPIVGGTNGVRYVANLTSQAWTVTANGTVTVAFTTQYEVTITAGTGGSVSPVGSQWVNQGDPLTVTATANASFVFANWSAGSTSTNPTLNLVVNGPLVLTAAFAPVYPPATTTSSGGTAGMPIALGLLVGLLIVGLVIGLLLGRRGARGGPPKEWSESTEPPAAADGPAAYEETPDTVESPPGG